MKQSLGAGALAMPLPVWVIGSYGEDSAPNLLTAAWCGVCCSEPPCVAVGIRKTRHSHGSILARRAFTVNIPAARHVAAVDYIGLVSGKYAAKFPAAGLTPVRGEHVDAPYVDEFPLVLECTVAEAIDLGSHTLFVGRIADVKADGAVLGADGLPELAGVDPLVCSPADKLYYEVGRSLGRTYSLGRTPSELAKVE